MSFKGWNKIISEILIEAEEPLWYNRVRIKKGIPADGIMVE